MFAHKCDLVLATNASSIDRNLTLSISNDSDVLSDTLAVIHDSFVNVIPVTSTSRRSKYVPINKGDERGKGSVKQVKWVELDQCTFFVVASTYGLQIYDREVSNVLYYHGMRETGDERSYTNGICTLRSNILCIGTHLGTVWMFQLLDNMKDFKLINRIYAHDEAVLMLESVGNQMVSSSDIVVYMWAFNSKHLEIIRKFEVAGVIAQPTAIKFNFGFVIIAYTSGEFCIFDVNDEDFFKRTTAHKLKITDIDFSASFTILTVSSDCYLKIWKYYQLKEEVALVQSILNEEGPLYGVGFLNCSCTEFCTVTGERTKVKVYIDWESEVNINIKEDNLFKTKND